MTGDGRDETPEQWVPRPARGYSWPQATSGNSLALRHGANSEAVLSPIIAGILSWAETHAGWLDAELDSPAVTAWARAEARAIVLADYCDQLGPLEDDGSVRPALTALERAERAAARARERLGFDPRARAELMRERASAEASVVDLEDLRQRGREALAAAERRADASGA